ncbi:hypothetical protein LXA43DRAFT_1006699 [Ganoderma leucocontextum]|nr:hypothetical protein LXA43DRAFT_1006699 [Ganoderma leucocontextum]
MTPSSSPTGSQRDGSVDHSPQSQHSSERPERSRNAKAQARHRAKRKAYIEQLEQTVTKLQSVLALSPDQVAAIPPPLMRIRELEQENELLHREVEELRRQLEMKNTQLRTDFRRDTYTPLPDDRHFDRESKRRRTADVGGVYVTSSHSPPPPLSIPSITGQYSSQNSHTSAYPPYSSRPLGGNYSYGVPGYPVPPETPTSSATSSPSFSPSDYAPSSLPSHSHHRTLSSAYGHTALPPFSHSPSQYELVKLEDDQYTNPHHSSTTTTNASHYSSAVHASHGGQAVAHWQYSSER